MVFSSLLFLFRFLPVILVLYFLSPKRLRNAVLFFSSLIFYAWGEPVYVVLMLFSTIVDFTHGMLVEKFKTKGQIKKAKAAVASSMIINLLLLGFFKYSDFLISNLNQFLHIEIPLLNLALPIGISFYTFQTMSYTVDVFRGQAKVQKNIISFGAYVALFPQLIAGPIVQYKTIAEQLNNRKEGFEQFSYGVMRFMTGLGKKVLLANNIGLLWDKIQAMPVGELPILTSWLGITAFAFQIYFDFSGYSDMAIGLGHILGFRFLENFNYPYMSKSITEFWRRWHISLGSWFRDYVYIPLGGNRKGAAKQVRNIAIVWFLTGIWHGASWNFLFWGIYFGIILIIEKFVLLRWLKKLPEIISHIYALFFIWIGWVIFAFDDFSKASNYLKSMFGGYKVGFADKNTMYLLSNFLIMLIILILACTDYPKRIAERIFGTNSLLTELTQTSAENSIGIKTSQLLDEKITKSATQKNRQLRTIACSVFIIGIFIISVAYLVDASYNPFLYFRF